jgi:cytoskeletal protein CcmA (bactofilin family)
MGKAKKNDVITTFFGVDTLVEGNLVFKGTIRIDGRVKGKIRSDDGTVIIGEKAVVEADIAVDNAVIMGQLTGSVNARDRIEAYAPASIVGDIRAPVVTIDAGVRFDGKCSMGAQLMLPENSLPSSDE